MSTRLVDRGWGNELSDSVRAHSGPLDIVTPFIKLKALSSLLAHRPKPVRVITRFDLNGFAAGVSDVSALHELLNANASVRGIKHLHAKVFLCGDIRAVVTSANLTQAAFDRNHEFGVVSDDAVVFSACRAYFDRLWNIAGPDLTHSQIKRWLAKLEKHRVQARAQRGPTKLPDYGSDAGFQPDPNLPGASIGVAPQAFVKFLGEWNNRADPILETIEEIKRSGAHRVLSYPTSKRPRVVRDGAVMFIGRLVKPKDIRVFGWAIAKHYEEGKDDARRQDIRQRSFMKKWSRFIRVSEAEFVDGAVANGVSLNEMMQALGKNSFRSTQRNALKRSGNLDPRQAYNQQAAVELSVEGRLWLADRLSRALDVHGRVPQETLDAIE